jgi:DNA-binding transcriptional MerR regulator
MKDLSIKKLYYSISEVSRLTGLEQYILRYWETEFEELRPSKNRAGNRIYTNRDIQTILKIKKLLREQKYTIEGARKILSEKIAEETEEPQLFSDSSYAEKAKKGNGRNSSLEKDLEDIKKFLLTIQNML